VADRLDDLLKRGVISNRAADRMTANAPYLGGTNMRPYNTPLPPAEEMIFRGWVKKNNVPFDPNAGTTDYDMRGFWQGLMQGHPMAKSAVDPNDSRLHYPDYWKTPLHETFSQESQWAGPTAPQWNPKDQLIAPSGRILFDDRSEK
jgi:hypothetical protein